MGFFKRFFNAMFRPPILDMFEHPTTGMQALQLLQDMPATEAVSLLLDGLQNHRTSKVRAMCAKTLLPYELDDSELRLVIQALDDPSAAVRQSVASFFGLRGSQRRPVYAALNPLVEAMNKKNSSLQGNEFEEMIARSSLPMTVAAAIKTTVGAENLTLNYENLPLDLRSIKESMEEIASDPSDSATAEDAKQYLRHLFSAR